MRERRERGEGNVRGGHTGKFVAYEEGIRGTSEGDSSGGVGMNNDGTDYMSRKIQFVYSCYK